MKVSITLVLGFLVSSASTIAVGRAGFSRPPLQAAGEPRFFYTGSGSRRPISSQPIQATRSSSRKVIGDASNTITDSQQSVRHHQESLNRPGTPFISPIVQPPVPVIHENRPRFAPVLRPTKLNLTIQHHGLDNQPGAQQPAFGGPKIRLDAEADPFTRRLTVPAANIIPSQPQQNDDQQSSYYFE